MNTNKHSKKVVHLPKFIQKNHTAILFSLLLFLMLPVTFVHAQLSLIHIFSGKSLLHLRYEVGFLSLVYQNQTQALPVCS